MTFSKADKESLGGCVSESHPPQNQRLWWPVARHPIRFHPYPPNTSTDCPLCSGADPSKLGRKQETLTMNSGDVLRLVWAVDLRVRSDGVLSDPAVHGLVPGMDPPKIEVTHNDWSSDFSTRRLIPKIHPMMGYPLSGSSMILPMVCPMIHPRFFQWFIQPSSSQLAEDLSNDSSIMLPMSWNLIYSIQWFSSNDCHPPMTVI